jgi:hypothetical protein
MAGGTTAADVGGEGGLRAGRNASPTQPAKATADIHVDNRLSVLSTDVKDAMRTCWSSLAETLLRSPRSHHLPSARQKCDLHSSVMSEKFAIIGGKVWSEFLDLNHTSKALILVSLMIPKFAPDLAANFGELRNRDTSA